MEDLPAWLTPLPDAETMRGVDRWAIEAQGVESLELMERAGAAAAAAVERLAPDGPAAVLCGKGNNGGDGLVVARLLRDAGRDVAVILTSPPQELEGDARVNLERLQGAGPLRLDGAPWEQEPGAAGGEPPLQDSVAIVDALLGTGFRGVPHGEVAEAIAAIGRSPAPVISVDVPSGVDAS
ncbi:MAG TPA: NAD(P)H-hydrate epimerase, partial [Solirubrobacteraceae bacterium]